MLNTELFSWSLHSPSLWAPPGVGDIKGNFDAAVRDSFAVTGAIISDSSDNIIMAATQRLYSTDILVSEASAALLASRLLALSSGIDHFVLEGSGDALLVILEINSLELFALWNFSN